jgi:hypothetical protein
MLKKNSYLLGILIGVVTPLLLFGILYGLNLMTGIFSTSLVMLPPKKMLFVCTALNIIPIRYYFTHKDLGKTGQGILFVTVFLIFMVLLAY